MGSFSRRRPAVRLMVSRLLQFFDQPPGAVSGALRYPGFSPQSSGPGCCSVLRQHLGAGVPEETGGHPVSDPQLGGPGHPSFVRGPSHSAAAVVYPGQAQCVGGFPEPQVTSPRLRVDPLLRSFPLASSLLACDDRPLCHFPESPSSGVLFANGGSAVGGHGCHASAVGWPPGLCLPSLWLDSSGSGQGPAFPGSGAYAGGSILDSAPLVSGPSRASDGDSLLPATKEGSTQTATLPSLPPEPPRASADCVSFVKRSARHFGFSKEVARQLAHCCRRSTRVNYQAK